MYKIYRHIIYLFALAILAGCSGNLSSTLLFEDEFDHLPTGVLSTSTGALSEFFYMPDAGQKGNWTVISYGRDKGYEKAWEIVEKNGRNVLRQNYRNLGDEMDLKSRHFHPAIIGGDSAWTNYSVRFTFKPYGLIDKCGLMFRYQNNRCYYFFGMEGKTLTLKLVQHATAPYRPYEKILASRNFNWEKGVEYEGVVTLRDERIYAQVNDSINLVATDITIPQGKVGLLSDVKAEFKSLEVSTLKSEKRKLNRYKGQISNQMAMGLSENPDAVLSKTISTEGFGSGSNLRFGDLNGDGEEDILIAQLKNDDHLQSLACLTALTSRGDILWENGTQQQGEQLYTIDFPIQIHDIDGDGSKEVIYISGESIYILNGASGKRLRKLAMPDAKDKMDSDTYLTKSIFFCDLHAKGRDSDMIVLDGNVIHAYDERIRPLWTQEVVNASYPAAADIDHDGKDEIATGYALLDDDGSIIWNVEKQFGSEVGEVAMLSLNPEDDNLISVVYGAGDWGCIVLDQSGELIAHHPIGNVRSLTIGNFRNERKGLEMITSNFWGGQGLIHFYNSDGTIYNSFEPGSFGSRCLPVNWMGNGEDYFILNASSGDGGLFNGKGQLMVVLPDDGHPDLNHTVLDISGDSRDEIVVWDQNSIWIYSQIDNPRKGIQDKAFRSPLYNSSFHQSMISIPHWDQ
jgi:rhamnogalacturonan endolyase